MEPMNELKVGQDVQLHCIVKSCDLEEASIWYAQVGNVFFRAVGSWSLDCQR